MGPTKETDVAIVGIGLRLPPALDSPAALWDFLLRGGDAVGPIPPDRWRWQHYFDPDPAKPGRMNVTRAALLEQPIDDIDREFFGISIREAVQLDPQQRLMLEVSWEALEDAGVDVWSLRGSRTGVFVGAFMLDNLIQRATPEARGSLDHHTATTCTNTVLSSRLSYFYDFRGPCMTIDTACSSSLVAVHQAVVSLNRGEVDLALAGGVNRIFRPEPMLMMSKGQFLAPDGRSKSFSAAADGYGRGEGCALVALKRLADAERDGDRIYAVIEGTGVNHDGRTAGPSHPSADAQATLIAEVLERGALDPASVDYVEAHGTGTAAGDPAEMQALGGLIGTASGRAGPCVVGSLKAGLGHLEGAAGVAGLIKAALVARTSVVPPQAWLDELNPNIDFDELGLLVPSEVTPLQNPIERTVRVAVNSFGYGGTNAHAVLRAPASSAFESPVDRPVEDLGGFFHPSVLVSGHTPEAAAAVAGTYADRLAESDEVERDRLVTAWSSRTTHEYRRAVVGVPGDRERLLRQLASGGQHPDILEGRAAGNRPIQPAFVFSGMGPQWWGMGRELIERNPIAAAHARRCDEAFRAIAGWSVLDELRAPEHSSRLTHTEVAQPATFVVQTSIAAVLEAVGVKPSGILGHSVGEVSAAYVAGSLSLQDALSVSYHRSRLQARTAGHGGMLAAHLSEGDAAELVERYQGRVALAAVNSTHAVTIAGDVESLQEIESELVAHGTFARMLSVDVPYHSPAMDSIVEELRDELADIQPAQVHGLVSSVSAEFDGGGWNADYWVHNVRDTVRFSEAADRLRATGCGLFVEVGPHPVLAMYLRDISAVARDTNVITTLSRERSDRDALTEAILRMWLQGVPIDWASALGAERDHHLPRYPWQRTNLWLEPSAIARARTGGPSVGGPDHPAMAGDPAASAIPAVEINLSPVTIPWSRSHLIGGSPVLPIVAFLEAAVLFARSANRGAEHIVIDDLLVAWPLVMQVNDDPVLRLSEVGDGRIEFHSRRSTDDEWRLNGSARVSRLSFAPGAVGEARHQSGVDVDVDAVYGALASVGMVYEGMFRIVSSIRLVGDSVRVAVDSPSEPEGVLWPPVLDAALHGALGAHVLAGGEPLLPVRIGRVIVHSSLPARVLASAQLVAAEGGRRSGHVTISDEAGTVLVELHDVELRAMPGPDNETTQLDQSTYEVSWVDASNLEERDVEIDQWTTTGWSDLELRLDDRCAAGRAVRVADNTTGGDHDEARSDWRTGRVVVIEADDSLSNPREDAISSVLDVLRREGLQELVLVTIDSLAVLPTDRCTGWMAGWVSGLARTLVNEYPEVRIRHVDWDGVDIDVLATTIAGSHLDEVAIRGGRVLQPRCQYSSLSNLEDWWAASPTFEPGSVETFRLLRRPGRPDLRWVASERRAPEATEIEVRTTAVGLNYKDLLKRVGVLNDEATAGSHSGATLGMEQCVVVERIGSAVTEVAPGDRLLAGLPDGFRRHHTIEAHRSLLVAAPEAFSDIDAASILVPFLTAHRTLSEIAQVGPGTTVLVHSAAGGLGLAAVQVAQSLGARVLATAGSDRKRAALEELGVAATFDSRSFDFIHGVCDLTGGAGVDVVLNTLPGDGLRAAFEVIADGGHVIEVGRREIVTKGVLPLACLDRNVTLSAFDLELLAKNREQFLALADRVLSRFAVGAYSPVPASVVAAADVERALDAVAKADHIGKLVVDLDDTTALAVVDDVEPRERMLRRDHWYVVSGGTGGLGLEIARWLAGRGAGRLALFSRGGRLDARGHRVVADLMSDGIEVQVFGADVSLSEAVEHSLNTLRDSAPIGGVVHAAGVAHDLPASELAPADLREVFAPKVDGALNLHRLTASDDLDLFLVLSSVSALTGTSGQAAYAAANSMIESLMHWRRRQRLPGAALALGPVANVGMAAVSESVARYVELLGFEPIPSDRLGAILDRAAVWNRPVLGYFDLDWSTWRLVEPRAAASARFKELVVDGRAGQSGSGAWTELAKLSSEARIAALVELVRNGLATVLAVDSEDLDVDASMSLLGLDSLMIVELQSSLNYTLGTDLTLMGLLGLDSIREVAVVLEDRLSSVVDGAPTVDEVVPGGPAS